MRRRPSLFWRILLGLLLLALLFPTTSPLISFGNTPTAPNASTTEASGHPMIFEDVEESDYFYDAVRWAVEHGITEGTSDTTFAPKDYCSRGQVITFLWKAMGSPEPQSSSHPFTDVPEDAYYTKAVLWAAEQNIASGTSESTFAPNALCPGTGHDLSVETEGAAGCNQQRRKFPRCYHRGLLLCTGHVGRKGENHHRTHRFPFRRNGSVQPRSGGHVPLACAWQTIIPITTNRRIYRTSADPPVLLFFHRRKTVS